MNEILKMILTSKEKDELLNFLDELKNKIFYPVLNLTEFIDKNAPQKFINPLKQSLTSNINSDEGEEILKKIKELENQINSLSKVILTLANDPDEKTIDMVKKYFEVTTGKHVIIEFVKNPKIIGGALIESSGYIFEHSFRDYFEKKGGGKNGL